MRSRTVSALASLAVLISVFQFSSTPAATPSGVSVAARHPKATWTGGPLNGSAPARRGITCDPSDTHAPNCDEQTLSVAAPAAPAGKIWVLTVTVIPSADNAMEINVCKPGACASISSTDYDNFTTSGQVNGITTTPTAGPVTARYEAPKSGTWKIRAACIQCANAMYSATATLTLVKLPAAPKSSGPRMFVTQTLPGLNAKSVAGGGEPGIRIGRHGEIWVDAPGDAGDFWGSYNGGKSFKLAQPGAGDVPNDVSGPGDTWMTVDADGTLYADILYLSLGGGNIVYRSRDKGATWTSLPGASNFAPGQKAALANVNSDRQWLTADPQTAGTVYFTYHDLADGTIWVYKTTDHGDTWTPTAAITGQELIERHEIDTFAGNTSGPIVISPDGSMYFTVSFSDFAEGQTALPTRQDFDLTKIFVVRSTDGGANWHFSLAHDGTGKEYIDHGHTPLNVDRSGNVYLVYSSRASKDGLPDPSHLGSPTPSGVTTDLFLISSKDRGMTWSKPVEVSTNNASNVFPALAAGGKAGTIDIAWLASSSKDFNDHNAQWTVQWVQSRNALTAKPTFAGTQVSPGVVHKHDICQAGTLCLATQGNRNLLDYIWMETDARGVAHIVYPDDSSGELKTIYATQKSGYSTLGRKL